MFPATVQSAGREVAGETCRHHSVPDSLFPHHEGHWWSSQRQGGEGGSEPQSSIASSWSARSSNMLLMSSKMFLAECAVPGWLGRKGRESKHCPKAAGADGEGLARLDPIQQQELNTELGLSTCDLRGADMTCPCAALLLPLLGPPQPLSRGLAPEFPSPLCLLHCDLLLCCLQCGSQAGVGLLQPLLGQGDPWGSCQRLC